MVDRSSTPGAGGSRHHLASTAVIFVIALIAMALVVANATSGDPAPTPQPTQPSTAAAPQTTALIQVSDGRSSLVSTLTASGGSRERGVLIGVPRETAVFEGGLGSSLYASTISTDERASARALSATTGVRIDIHWKMDRRALAGWVDAVGGVEVASDEVLRFRDSEGAVKLRLPSGTRRLSGPEASWYVTGWINGESTSEEAQNRWGDVLGQILAALPPAPDAIRQILISLGALSSPSVGSTELAGYLAALSAHARQNAVDEVELPLLRPAPPGVIDSARSQAPQPPSGVALGPAIVDQLSATPELRRLFVDAPRVPSQRIGPRVLLWDGDADKGSEAAAIAQVGDAGMIGVPAGRWAGGVTDATTTRVRGRGYSPDGTSWADLAAAALAIDAGRVNGDVGSVSPSPEPEADVAAGGDGESTAPAPTMPEPTARPWGDVDAVLGNDYLGCEATGLCQEIDVTEGL